MEDKIYEETEEITEPEEPSALEEEEERKKEGASLHDHLMGLIAQAEDLKKDLPDFNLAQALTDPEFVRLTSPLSGVSVKRAYAAIHADEIAARAARTSAQKLAASVSSGVRRPQEGGSSAAAAVSKPDPKHMSREMRMELRQRIRDAAARGEKIYPV